MSNQRRTRCWFASRNELCLLLGEVENATKVFFNGQLLEGISRSQELIETIRRRFGLQHDRKIPFASRGVKEVGSAESFVDSTDLRRGEPGLLWLNAVNPAIHHAGGAALGLCALTRYFLGRAVRIETPQEAISRIGEYSICNR